MSGYCRLGPLETVTRELPKYKLDLTGVRFLVGKESEQQLRA